jgi:drug/metabolite transporter (DMT)-like permease
MKVPRIRNMNGERWLPTRPTARNDSIERCQLGRWPGPSVERSRRLAILALVGANVIWGTTFVATKPMLERIPPITLATARFAIAYAVLLPLLAQMNARPARGRPIAIMGFTGIFLVYLCQNAGLQYTSAANGALIHGGIPVFTGLIAMVALRERLTWSRSVGIGASLVGVTIIILAGSGATIAVSFLGDLLVFVSGLALAVYFVLGRIRFPHGNSLALVGGITRYGLFFLLPASMIEMVAVGVDRPTLGDVAGLMYLGIAASAFAFVLWAYGLRHMEASQATIFANLSPLVGVVVAALLLSEPITQVQLSGGFLIMAGVWVATTDMFHPAGRCLNKVRRTLGPALIGLNPVVAVHRRRR